MNDRAFVDTNILVYAVDTRAAAKQARAAAVIEELITSSRAVVSTQVLQEYFVHALKLRIPASEVRANVEVYSQLEVVLVGPELILGAIDLHRLHHLSFWDALIIRCASAAGCGRVLTEHMNHGQIINGVRIENPFLAVADKAKERTASWRVAGGGRRTARRTRRA